MIEHCSVCNTLVKTKFKLKFQDLPGANEENYTQNVGICENCGYIFTQNPFSSEQLENRYKKMSKFEYDSKYYVLTNEFKKQSLRQYHFLTENLDFNNINSIIEIGAASGYNLSLYTDICENVKGIEPSEENCRLAKQNYNVDMFNGMFNEYLASNPQTRYDIVFLSMVLEHIVDPANFIHSCKKLCNKYMFIEIPTLDLRHDEEPMGIFAEEHVSLFTLDSLYELMRRAGFKLLNVETIYGLRRYLPAGYPAIATIWELTNEPQKPYKFNLFSSSELLDKYISSSNSELEKIRNKIDQIPNDMKVAVWGIGHHASMLLANTSLKSKNIVRVYDSDIRKHGITFAGVEITSFKKEDVKTGVVDGILLTTYTAQNAIENYLKKTGVDCKIYTLYNI